MAKRPNFLVFGKPNIGPEEIAEVVATLASGWIGTGPKVHKFEEMFKKYKSPKRSGKKCEVFYYPGCC